MTTRTVKQEIEGIRAHLKAMEPKLTPDEQSKVLEYIREAWTCLGEGLAKLKAPAIVLLCLVFMAGLSSAWETKDNPDRFPSIGFDLIKGQQAGIVRAGSVGGDQTSGGLLGGRVDFRLPVTAAFTFHAGAEQVGIDNNLAYTEGYRLEIGGRVYFRD